MKQIISLASLSFLTFLLVACGHKADDNAAAEAAQLSCTNPSASQCTEFPGGDAGVVEQLCGAINGTLAKSPAIR